MGDTARGSDCGLCMPLKESEPRSPLKVSITIMDTIDKNPQTNESIKPVGAFLVCLNNARVRPVERAQLLGADSWLIVARWTCRSCLSSSSSALGQSELARARLNALLGPKESAP